MSEALGAPSRYEKPEEALKKPAKALDNWTFE
jgi:hypothetical protein